MQVPVYSFTGKVLEHIEISDRVFATPFNEGIVHQAVVRQRANARQGTHDTKTRGEITSSGGKLFRQKGTGLARAGSRRSPLRRGGGIVFGPHPRSYRQAMPKKMRQLALRCVLSAKARDEELKILQQLELAEPKTKMMAEILSALGVDAPTLVVIPEPEVNVIKSARNLKGVKTTPANLLNVLDILSHKMLLMSVAAVRKAEQLWGESAATEADHAPV
jgi:large subunit ribosomal protein L4